MAPVVVIGGGVAGMAAAARLAKLGHSVTLCEKTAELGGRFRAVDGPTTLTLPAALRDLFRKSGRPLERELDLQPVRTPRRHVFPDGTVLDLPINGRADQHAAIAATLGGPAADAWARLIDDCVPLWDLLRQHVLEHPYRGPRSFGLAGLRRLRPGRSLRGLIRRALPEERARLAMGTTALGPGADPARAPAYQIVHAYVERTFGRWACADGLGALLTAFERRLTERQVRVETSSEVTTIEVTNGAVDGVQLAHGQQREASIVICTVPAAGLLAAPPPVLGSADRQRRAGTAVARVEVHDPLSDEPFEVLHYPADDEPPVGETVRGGPARLLHRPGHRRAPEPTRTPVAGLFRAGPTAQPGPGLPYELLGAALVATEVGAAARRNATA